MTDFIVNFSENDMELNAEFDENAPTIVRGVTDVTVNGTSVVSNHTATITVPYADVTANTTARHTHSNKATLDTITAEKIAEIGENTASRHSHTNKTVLDSITSEKVTSWDGKQNKLTAGTGISISNGVISCTFADGNEVSY